MFTVKKTIILVITFLFLLSTMVVATYTPTVQTTWGDFAEKTSVTKDIVSDTEYSFSVLSEKHTFKVTISGTAPSTDFKTSLSVFLDGKQVDSPVISENSKSGNKQFTQQIEGVGVSFSVTGDYYHPENNKVIISTNGVTSASLLAAKLISKSEQGENSGVYFSTSTLTTGGVIHFSLDGTLFTVVYREHKTDGVNEFTLAF